MERLKELAKSALKRIKEEPVLLTSAIALALNAAAFLGFNLDPTLIAQIDVLLVPLLGLLTRKYVAPVSKLRRLSPEELARLLEA